MIKEIPILPPLANEAVVPDEELQKVEAIQSRGAFPSEQRRVGQNTFSVPNENLAEILSQADPRVEFCKPLATQPQELSYDFNTLFAYNEAVSDVVAQSIAKYIEEHKAADPQFTEKDVVVRAVSLSINGGVVDRAAGIAVRDIAQALESGSDRFESDTSFSVGGFGRHSDGKYHLHQQVNQAAATGTQNLIQNLHKNGVAPHMLDAIFPVVLIYDKRMLTRSGNYGVGFRPGADRSKAILKAYVLPRIALP